MKKTTKIINVLMVAMLILVLPIAVNAQNSPTIKLSVANYDPMPVQPGQFVDVWVSVQNIGTAEAENIVIEFLESPYFELANPNNKIQEIGVLGTYKDYTLRYRFKVSNDVVEGTNELKFQYTVENQPGVITTSNLKLDVKSTEVPVSISSVKLNPDPVAPGQTTELLLAVKNLATSSNLRDVSVELQLVSQQSGQLAELPFATVDSSNRKSINRIQAGQTTEFKFSLVAYPEAESKIYKLPVTITYFDDTGRQYEETMFASINVNSEPDLYVMIESTTLDKNIKTGEVILDVVNQGVSNIKLLTFILNENSGFKIDSPSNREYLGNIESDDFKSARFRITINEDVDEVILPVTLTFRDALNNEFTENLEIKYSLREPQGNGKNTGTIIVLLIILAIAGLFYYRRRQKRKKLLKDDD